MNCVKCGRDISDGAAFCRICLAEMEDYPVKPGTVVLLPKTELPSAAKKPVSKKRPSAEEQLATTKKKLRRSRCFTAFLLLLVLGMGAVIYMVSAQLDIQKLWGQNYSTVVNTDSSGTSNLPKPTLPPASS